jgi:hypothetical protein
MVGLLIIVGQVIVVGLVIEVGLVIVVGPFLPLSLSVLEILQGLKQCIQLKNEQLKFSA